MMVASLTLLAAGPAIELAQRDTCAPKTRNARRLGVVTLDVAGSSVKFVPPSPWAAEVEAKSLNQSPPTMVMAWRNQTGHLLKGQLAWKDDTHTTPRQFSLFAAHYKDHSTWTCQKAFGQ